MFESLYKSNEGLFQLIALALAYLGIIQPIRQYISAQKKINRENRFKTYHEMIDHLSSGKDGTPMLARQVAIVYELRRFPEYYPVTKRILPLWKRNLNSVSAEGDDKPDYSPLYNEIDLTLKFIYDGPVIRFLYRIGVISKRNTVW